MTQEKLIQFCVRIKNREKKKNSRRQKKGRKKMGYCASEEKQISTKEKKGKEASIMPTVSTVRSSLKRGKRACYSPTFSPRIFPPKEVAFQWLNHCGGLLRWRFLTRSVCRTIIIVASNESSSCRVSLSISGKKKRNIHVLETCFLPHRAKRSARRSVRQLFGGRIFEKCRLVHSLYFRDINFDFSSKITRRERERDRAIQRLLSFPIFFTLNVKTYE